MIYRDGVEDALTFAFRFTDATISIPNQGRLKLYPSHTLELSLVLILNLWVVSKSFLCCSEFAKSIRYIFYALLNKRILLLLFDKFPSWETSKKHSDSRRICCLFHLVESLRNNLGFNALEIIALTLFIFISGGLSFWLVIKFFLVISLIYHAGVDLIRQGWSRRGPNVLQEGYGSASVLPEQGIYLAASMYRPVLQVCDWKFQVSKHKMAYMYKDGSLSLFWSPVLFSLRIRLHHCCQRSIPSLGKFRNHFPFQAYLHNEKILFL